MAEQLTADDLLAVAGRVVPETYLQPIRDVGPGYELYQASAAVMARTSLATARFEDDVYILTAKGGALATVPVTFYRLTATAGAVTMLAGTLVRASSRGVSYRTLTDAAFGPTDLTATTSAIATGYGYEWNIRGPFVDRDGAVWPGDLDTIDMPMQDPVFGDPSVLVRNDADADGLGRPRSLDALGGERALPRHGSEGDVNYRVRIRTLPDTITPAAIFRQVANYFRPFPGLFWRIIETWKHEYQECYDAPELPPTATENYDKTLFVYDDPRPASPIRNRWLGENDYLAAFIVEVATPSAIDDFGFAYDDPAADAVGTPPSVATRALSSYDVPDFMAPPARAPAYDAPADFGITALFEGLYALLDEIKPAGAFVVIHIQEQ